MVYTRMLVVESWTVVLVLCIHECVACNTEKAGFHHAVEWAWLPSPKDFTAMYKLLTNSIHTNLILSLFSPMICHIFPSCQSSSNQIDVGHSIDTFQRNAESRCCTSLWTEGCQFSGHVSMPQGGSIQMAKLAMSDLCWPWCGDGHH